MLIRFGSPHFSDKEAGQKLREDLFRSVNLIAEADLRFDRAQILCANEAFPEAAVSDPIADLEIWDEWSSGVRAFPYSGHYKRLGIRTQESKISSASSMGVLGEIFAGLLAQVFISPWVLVRVVRRWPDLIFYSGNDQYAFVEAKAFNEPRLTRTDRLRGRVPDKLLGECIVASVRQINSDAFTTVWGAFTNVIQVTPMRLQVTFIDFSAEDHRRVQQAERFLPEPVVVGLSERAIVRATSKLAEDELQGLRRVRRTRRPSTDSSQLEWDFRLEVEKKLDSLVREELSELLSYADAELAVRNSQAILIEEAERQVRQMIFPEVYDGRRLLTAKERAAEGLLSEVRRIGNKSVLLADLDHDARAQIDNSFVPDWTQAPLHWGAVEELKLWRCGAAVLGLGDQRLGGKPIK